MQLFILVSVISLIDDFDIYDNVYIKNILLGVKDGLYGVFILGVKDGVVEVCIGEMDECIVFGGFVGESKEFVDIGNEIVLLGIQEMKGDVVNIIECELMDGNFEIDFGGMGCESFVQVIEE